MRARATLVAAAVLTLIMTGSQARSAESSANVFESNILFCDTPVCVPGDTAGSTVTIAKGGTVTFVFADALCTAFAALGCAHTVKSVNGAFPTTNPQSITSPAPVVLTFNAVGNFSYVCGIHGAVMHGVVHVVT